MALKFQVTIHGSFHCAELYDQQGAHVFNCFTAADVAEEIYGDEWETVFNGQESMDRDDYILAKEYGGLYQRANMLVSEAHMDKMSVREAAVYVAESLLDEFDCEVHGA